MLSRSLSPPAIALWLGVQVLALCISAFRLPLSSRFVEPAEDWAFHVILCAQIASLSMLWPLLMRNWQMTCVVVIATWPFLQMSAFLSAIDAQVLLRCAMYITLWIIALHCVGLMVRTNRGKMIAVAITSAWALGGISALYLKDEFGTQGSPSLLYESFVFGPIYGAMKQKNGIAPDAWLWIILIACAFTVMHLIMRRHPRRIMLSTRLPQQSQ